MLVINSRYALMSLSLSQKMGQRIGVLPRFAIAFFNTDEIFALAMAEPQPLTVPFLLGLGLTPFIGWTGGTLCGALNGIIMTKFTELAPMIVTLATNIIFRGLSERILGDGSTGGMQKVEWFGNIFYGRIGGIVPYPFVIFVVLAILFGVVMHKTVFGRHMFAIGENKKAAAYAGVKVEKIRMIVFTLTGFICGFAAVIYCANLGSVKSNVADGFELEAISMCVLGGISTAGGKGTMVGAVIAIFIIGLLRYGLNLINLSGQTIRIILGILLILVVLFPTIREAIGSRKKAAK